MRIGANDPDRDWELLGATDPYFSVLTHPRYHTANLTDEALKDFFHSGDRHVEALWTAARQHFSPTFNPARALDFGCGVGRVLIPLARRCSEVVGVDVSPSMLAEAARNCQVRGVNNVQLLLVGDKLSGLSGTFDFVHSFIVFQHIPVAKGEELTRLLVEAIREGGIGALHYTYHIGISAFMRGYTWAKIHVSVMQPLINLAKARPVTTPLMQMNEYSITRLVRILHDGGCDEIYSQATRHGEPGSAVVQGVLLMFRKTRIASL